MPEILLCRAFSQRSFSAMEERRGSANMSGAAWLEAFLRSSFSSMR